MDVGAAETGAGEAEEELAGAWTGVLVMYNFGWTGKGSGRTRFRDVDILDLEAEIRSFVDDDTGFAFLGNLFFCCFRHGRSCH